MHTSIHILNLAFWCAIAYAVYCALRRAKNRNK
jgi:hypothetical protein